MNENRCPMTATRCTIWQQRRPVAPYSAPSRIPFIAANRYLWSWLTHLIGLVVFAGIDSVDLATEHRAPRTVARRCPAPGRGGLAHHRDRPSVVHPASRGHRPQGSRPWWCGSLPAIRDPRRDGVQPRTGSPPGRRLVYVGLNRITPGLCLDRRAPDRTLRSCSKTAEPPDSRRGTAVKVHGFANALGDHRPWG